MRRLVHRMKGQSNTAYSEPVPPQPVDGRFSDSSQDFKIDPLGLTVLFEPDGKPPSVDIVFVHGLRGRSMHTWSFDEDLEQFWPQKWLPTEPSIQNARISTFGYDSNYLAIGARKILNVTDFAKDLLSGLKFGLDKSNEALDFGKVPVIFVVHSMGGLVVKKAYILGTNDGNYEDIIKSTSAILFLSTPHRGAGLAELLNRVVKLLVPGRSTKEYIRELKKNSSTLEDINEQFRNLASRMEIVSFYETLGTVFGTHEAMILDKDSSVLGYPGELSIPLYANHRGVCKFPDRNDASYIKIRNVLRDMVTRLGAWSLKSQNPRASKMLHLVRGLLAVAQTPEEDHDFFSQRQTIGTCEWILSEPDFRAWLDDHSLMPRIIWYHGAPGTGKSVLASYVVDLIRKDHGSLCQFFHFRYDDQGKTSASSCLRSLAYQIACHVPEFQQRLAALGEAGALLEKADALFIWRRLFVDNLFSLHLPRPMYWVIDAFDECSSPSPLLSCFLQLAVSACSIRVMIVSRWTQKLSNSFEKTASAVRLDAHQIQAPGEDLARFVQAEMQDPEIPGDNKLKQRITSRILERTGGNFLWARLVLEELRDCRTENSMYEALASLPPDLEVLYQRMAVALSVKWKRGDKELARAILTWVACSRFPLTLQEISGALESQASTLLDLRATAGHVCGNFIEVDGGSRISLVHHSARDYLTISSDHVLSIHTPDAHLEIFRRCLLVLSNPALRSREAQVESGPFLRYAATSWPYHLASSSPASDDEVLSLLAGFFDSPSVLNWICVLSYGLELKQLVRASKALNSFLDRKNRQDADRSPLLHNLTAKDILQTMAVELLKILGKFGADLLRYPDAIYALIPPFCPSDSLIRRRFTTTGTTSMTVAGISESGWDDSLVKFLVTRGCKALRISCKDQYFAISTTSSLGHVKVFNTSSCGEAQNLSHGERVQSVQFSNSGLILASYGYLKTKIWDVAAAQVLYTFDNPRGTRLLAMGFLADDEAILTCSDDRTIRKFVLNEATHGFTALTSILVGDGSPDGRQFKAPSCASFNSVGTLLAVAYPGCPLSIWNIPENQLVNRYKRSASEDEHGHISQADIVQISWSPTSEHVLGTYNDGSLFKWQLSGNETALVLSADASTVRCSPTGSFVVTTDGSGTLKVWSFEDLSLIYQLSCPSQVSDLAINPDGKRVYDLRGSYCNIWEPNSLVRLADADERYSESGSTSASSARVSHISESSTEIPEPIEALAVGESTSVYCTGHLNGVLKVFDCNGTQLQVMTPSSVAVDHITWSEDERYLAVADIAARIYVNVFSNEFSRVDTILEKSLGESIQQILFNKSASFLLAVTKGSLTVWSLKEKPVWIKKSLLGIQYRWINHPYKDDLVVGLRPEGICVLRWNDLVMHCNVSISTSATLAQQVLDPAMSMQMPMGTASTTTTSLPVTFVEKALVSSSGSCILLQMCQEDQYTEVKKVIIINTADFETLGPSDKCTVTAVTIPDPLQAQIDRTLGFIGPGYVTSYPGNQGPDASPAQDQMIFLNKNGWLCTVPLSRVDGEASIKRHFFLPKDWLNIENLELAHITKEGTLVCPKDGEVGLICNGFKKELLSD